MNAYLKHLPVILLIDKDGQNRFPAKEWLKESRFRTWEAMNVFDALEGINDFTLKNRPDVVVLNVESMLRDFELLVGLLLNGKPDESEFPIFALSGGERMIGAADIFEGDLAELKAKLEELVPAQNRRVHSSA